MTKPAPVQFSLKALLAFTALGAGLVWLAAGDEQVRSSPFLVAYLLVGYGQAFLFVLLWQRVRWAADRDGKWPYGPRQSAWLGFWWSIPAGLVYVGLLALRRVEVAFFMSPATMDWIFGIVMLPILTAVVCLIPAAVINIASLVVHRRSYRDLPLTVLRLLNLANSVMGLPAFVSRLVH